MSKRRYQEINLSEMQEHFLYEHETGLFFRRTTPGTRWKEGQLAGSESVGGYIYLHLHGRSYLAHRVAFTMFYGNMPDLEIDHINGVRNDNRIVNLRACTIQENAFNISSINPKTNRSVGGFYVNKARKWQATIRVNGKNKSLGFFDTQEEANKAYRKAKAEFHPCAARFF